MHPIAKVAIGRCPLVSFDNGGASTAWESVKGISLENEFL
jgi:hypothetical protein